MSHIRTSRNKTSVKFLINTVATLTVIFAGTASFAEPSSPASGTTNTKDIVDALKNLPQSTSDYCKTDHPENPNYLKFCADQRAQVQADKLADQCSGSLRTEALAANKDLKTACADGGFAVTSCIEKAMACEVVPRELPSESGTNWNDAVNTVLKGLGMGAAATLGSNTAKKEDVGAPTSDTDCSDMTSEDYTTQRKDLQDQLKDLKKDLVEAQKDVSTQEKDSKKEVSEIQDDMTKEKEQAEKDKASMSDDMRKQVSDFMQTQNSIKDQIRSKTVSILDLRSKLTIAQRKQTQQIMQLNDAAMQSSCAKQAQDTYSKFQQAYAAGSTPYSVRTSQKKMVLNQYTDCMKLLEQQRLGIDENSRAEQQILITQINQAVAESGDIQTSLDSAANQLAEIQKQNTDQKSKMDQNLLTKMQTASSKMQTAATNLTQQQAISTSKQDQINKDINEINNKMMALGTRPPSGAKMAPAKVGAAISAAAETIASYTDVCCAGKGVGSSVGGDDLGSLCKKQKIFSDLANGTYGKSKSSTTRKTGGK